MDGVKTDGSASHLLNKRKATSITDFRSDRNRIRSDTKFRASFRDTLCFVFEPAPRSLTRTHVMQRSLPTLNRTSRKAAHSASLLRSGFTMIELLIVLVIIAILAGLLLPTLGSVRRSARVAQVTVDIKNIEAAIAAFKLKYGMEPPSSFLIGNDDDHYKSSALGRNSIALMRQLWPGYTPNEMSNNLPGQKIGSGPTYPIQLNGADCLAFFLGGPGIISTSGASGCRPNGFSANPADPFASGGTRVGPFLEFDTARLVDVNNNNVFELIDPLPNQTAPYQYLSSYDGKGYQPLGYDPSNNNDNEVFGTLRSPYLKNDINWPDGSVTPGSDPLGEGSGDYWNGKSYQIISPGFDGQYGIGGSYSSENGIAVYDAAADDKRSREARKAEADNITNFSGGMLEKFYAPTP